MQLILKKSFFQSYVLIHFTDFYNTTQPNSQGGGL